MEICIGLSMCFVILVSFDLDIPFEINIVFILK